ncbi:hypothetical protein OG594_46970 [Streptomyces sp. NBC_01214]|uniref:hypothetical protein n=1 Tax=Streptomyces sp. NBC_01214 TaxID=2903777 RepID=UPI002255E24D|nr:hypothetical protein [Streptomyces sp. NBC_01214]MCX4809000.1 hypothetical protein [Streptomyces sp. NBC_01214]
MSARVRPVWALRMLVGLWALMGIVAAVLLAAGLPAPATAVVAVAAGWAVGWPLAVREEARRTGAR